MLTPTFFLVRPCYLYPFRLSSLPAASLHHLTSKPHPPAVSPTRSPTCASARLSAHPSPRALAVCAPVRTTHAPSHIPQFPSHAYFMRLPLFPRLAPSLRVRRSQVRPFLSTIFASPPCGPHVVGPLLAFPRSRLVILILQMAHGRTFTSCVCVCERERERERRERISTKDS